MGSCILTNIIIEGITNKKKPRLPQGTYGVPFVSLFHKQNLHSIGKYLPTIAFLLAMIVIFFDNFFNNINTYWQSYL